MMHYVQVSCMAVLLGVATATAMPETIMGQIDLDYSDTANGNAIGGDDFFGRRLALQVCDDFVTTTTGHVITEVSVANLMWRPDLPTDARICIFAAIEERPSEEPVFTARVSELGLKVSNRRFVDGVFGLEGVQSTVSGLEICLLPDTHYYIDLQVYCGPNDWAYTMRYYILRGTDSFLRDGPTDEGEGGYGFTEWRSAGDAGHGTGDSAYRVEATSGSCCTGRERIARARCRAANSGNKLMVRLADGFPGDTFTVALSSGENESGTLDAEGKGRARFKRLLSGDGTATATWGCGASAQALYTCP